MKADLDHLPARQQHELARVRDHLLQEFEAAIKSGGGGTQSWRRDGRILKIVLFGSYSRDDWVDEPASGYLSDFDILVIVSHENLTKVADYWYVAEDKIFRDQSIGRIVNIIVHTMGEVNQALSRGEYFWTEIIRDGVVLYELPGFPFASPKPLTRLDAFEMAQRYFREWYPKVSTALDGVMFYLNKRELKDAAFLLHQAVERAYICVMLVLKLHAPRSHNIKFLRSVSEAADQRLVAAWPRESKLDRRRFELLKRAYVEARYVASYDISVEDLEALKGNVEHLRDLVDLVCRDRLDMLEQAVRAVGSE